LQDVAASIYYCLQYVKDWFMSVKRVVVFMLHSTDKLELGDKF